jgi:hypothetical protein
MKQLLLLFVFVVCLSANSQSTQTLMIEGAVVKPITIKFEDLKAYKSVSLDGLVILNHKMERKSSLKEIKGVLLKDVLDKAEFSVNSPRVLSEFYIVCIADDGYKVVFSWNEIFNSPTGDHALIVTDSNGASSITKKEGILLVVPTDKATGRRYVKNLSKISIQQVK